MDSVGVDLHMYGHLICDNVTAVLLREWMIFSFNGYEPVGILTSIAYYHKY